MTGSTLKVLILGGYGNFGGRLAELLADEARVTLMIAGRSRAKAEAFCRALDAVATALPRAFDREGDVDAQLRDCAPDIVVDATGPFQGYRDDPYRVVRAAIALGINYLDLSDGADFVNGIARFDAAARQRGVFVLSGVSSFPVLTAAVVRRLAKGMANVESVVGGIAPSPYANVGLNVLRAIASYAGKPVMTGDKRYALVDTRRYTIAPPGRLPLHPTRFSLVDVPDLLVLPGLWPSLRFVWIGAGPVPEIWHRCLNALAWAVRLRVLPSLLPFAHLMYRTIKVLRWGEHRGGMFVAVEGTALDGSRIERSWHMTAEREDGPMIPSMAVEAIVRHCLAGRVPSPGARPASGELEVDDYDALFARRSIATGFRETMPATAPLYRRLLGSGWEILPEPVRRMHDLAGVMTATGTATVERGGGFLGRCVAGVFGFPRAGTEVPVSVAFSRRDGREIWRRTFAGRSFSSTQEEGRGRFERLLVERFGPFAFGMALVLEDGCMRLIIRRWTAFGLPMPLALAPRGNAFEYADEGRFRFHVELRHPLAGLIVAYRGWLVPEP